MNPEQRLREEIDRERARLRSGIPSDRLAAIAVVLAAREQLPPSFDHDLVSGRHFPDLGANLALQFCLETTADTQVSADHDLDRWSLLFLQSCRRVAEAELVLAHCESGFMRMSEENEGSFHAWIASKRPPASWRERADIDAWELMLEREIGPEPSTPGPDPTSGADSEGLFDRRAAWHAQRLSYQLGYPQDAEVAGCQVRTILSVLELLISWALEEHDRGEEPTPRLVNALNDSISVALGIDAASIGRIVSAFTLDGDNAAFHAEVPGIAAAPLVRFDDERLIWSILGLTSEPLLFLTRELRRRSAQEYHNSAYLREVVFRDDVYSLFRDKRFVTSSTRIELRRKGGDLRTDVDAAVFDRRTGTLGVFELKSQDPFSRSLAELARRRDNLMYSNRQVSGLLDWVKHHGADDLLGRIDRQTAKKYRVHKVFTFVLGRYLVQFNDGPEPDRRAAWGSWPQVLRLLDGFSVNPTDSNPIASLFTRMQKDSGIEYSTEAVPSRQILIGTITLTIHPSYDAYTARTVN